MPCVLLMFHRGSIDQTEKRLSSISHERTALHTFFFPVDGPCSQFRCHPSLLICNYHKNAPHLYMNMAYRSSDISNNNFLKNTNPTAAPGAELPVRLNIASGCLSCYRDRLATMQGALEASVVPMGQTTTMPLSAKAAIACYNVSNHKYSNLTEA